MTMIEELKDELCRAYRVLGESAECQNYNDVTEWYRTKKITEFERRELLAYNRMLFKEYCA